MQCKGRQVVLAVSLQVAFQLLSTACKGIHVVVAGKKCMLETV